MSKQQVSLTVPTLCPACNVRRWAQFYSNYLGATIVLEWECTHCHCRWPVTDAHLTQHTTATIGSTPFQRESALLEEIASLREANEDLCASACRWRRLYQSAIGRCVQRENQQADATPEDVT